MAKFIRDHELDTYSGMIERFARKNSRKVIGEAIYKGAEVVADAIKEGIQDLPTEGGNGITQTQKQDLINSFGIASLREEKNYSNVKLGFDGYGSKPTKNYPKGLPNQLLARSIESGTSFRKKTPFIRKAVTKTAKKSIQVMQEVLEKETKKYLG